MAVLYRKYRPQTFSEVINQKPIIDTLRNQVATGAVSHAYLFTGSRGIGKTSVARILAKAVNCVTRIKNQESGSKKGVDDACGECGVCKQIEQGIFLDLVEIDAASNTGVDNIRELIEHVKFSPSTGQYKVFIIDEVHMLSKGAFNALLKTLEEPPKHAIFILATTEINKLPATVVSRTQRFNFKTYSAQDLMPLLEKVAREEKIEFKSNILDLIAQNAEGSARDALSLLDKVLTLGPDADLEQYQQLLGVTDINLSQSCLEFIAAGEATKLPGFFETLQEKGVDFAIFNRDFLEYLRKVLIFKVTGHFDAEFSQKQTELLNALSGELSAKDVMHYIRLFLRSYKELAFAPSALLPVLIAALEASYYKQTNPSQDTSNIKNQHFSEQVRKESNKTSVSSSAELDPDQKSSGFISQKQNEPLNPSAQPQISRAPVVESISVSGLDESVTREQLQVEWPKIINQLKAENGPLANLLKISPIQRLEKGRIVLGVKFIFHKQNLENKKNLEIICAVIQRVTGKRLFLCAEVLREESKVVNAAEALGDALKIFGGELIE